ncbi:DUF2631 domain-containing protein [Pseudonocardia sp.]|uniref:DUF2631 domain-containing protein n=1 Tax=Pseudonocardia sp. TaxID=60912 RepID=UPI00260B5280|nr:DUF2631 domain-containing protein [Pseudonocardia sp.]
MASNSRELEQRSEVGPQDEPSAEWGWHGGFPKGTIAGGIVTIILCAVFFIGPYQSRTQDLWLGGVILVVLIGMALQIRKKRNAWRR